MRRVVGRPDRGEATTCVTAEGVELVEIASSVERRVLDACDQQRRDRQIGLGAERLVAERVNERSCLPLASAISTFTRPLLKYSSRGTSVSPRSAVCLCQGRRGA